MDGISLNERTIISSYTIHTRRMLQWGEIIYDRELLFLYIFFFSALPFFRSKSIMDQSRIFWTQPKWKIKRLLQSGIGPWYMSDVFPCLYFLVRKEVFAKIILVFLDQKPKVFWFLYPMSRQYKLSVRPTTQKTGFNKGQLMSERNFGVFKSPIQPNRLVGFWGDLKIPKFPSEINWPLPGAILLYDVDILMVVSLPH